ncbi:MAG: YraN family protein [Ignavibacterium sp.]|nr:YraN family protein [Ignavibacterium sp.]MDW8375303.1 YraN family protein [Ignavibacteriales bacterium]
MSQQKSKLGKKGEEVAKDYLISKGYEIIKQNYRYGHGEIDLIAKIPERELLVFVEVKTRKNLELGDPILALNPKKISQLKKIAELYLYENQIKEIECRFDVITVLLEDSENPIVEHYEKAFI